MFVCECVLWGFIRRETVMQTVLWPVAVRSAHTSNELTSSSTSPPTWCVCVCVCVCVCSGEYEPLSPHLVHPTGCKNHTIVLEALSLLGTTGTLMKCWFTHQARGMLNITAYDLWPHVKCDESLSVALWGPEGDNGAFYLRKGRREKWNITQSHSSRHANARLWTTNWLHQLQQQAN